jgi:hypothetical protein
MKKFNEDALQLLVNDAHGVYIPEVFFKQYEGYIQKWFEENGSNLYTFESLKEGIMIDPYDNDMDKRESHYEAWDFILDYNGHGFYITDDNGIKMQLIQNGDVWALPYDMEVPEDFFS